MSETTTLMDKKSVDKEFEEIIETNFGMSKGISLDERYVGRGPQMGRRKMAKTALQEAKVVTLETPTEKEETPIPTVLPLETAPIPSADEVVDEAEVRETKTSLFKRAGRKLGKFAVRTGGAFKHAKEVVADKAGYAQAYAINRMMEGAGKLGERARKFDQNGRLTRNEKRKTVASIGALALLGGAGVVAYKMGHDHASFADTLSSMAPNHPRTLEGVNLDPATYQWNLDPAHTTNLVIGGRGDGTGLGLNNVVGKSPSPDFAAARTEFVEYSAQIAPMPGDTETLNQSVAPGARQVVEAIENSGNGQIHIIGHSQGTQVALRGVAEYMDAHNGMLPPNVKVTIIDSPNTPGSGVFHDEFIKEFKSVFDAAGIDMRAADLPDGTKGVTFIGGRKDFVANSGPGRNIFRKIGNLADFGLGGDGHAVQGFDDPSRHIVNEIDGNTYITVKPVGTQNPFLRLAEQHGMHVSPEADKAFEEWMPAGEVGKVAPEVNVNNAVDASADAVRRVLDDNHIAYDPAHFDLVKNLPIPQQVQDGVNQLLQPEAWVNNAPAQEAVTNYTPPVQAAPAQEYVAPVQEYVAPVQEYVAPVQDYVAPIEQQVEAVFQNVPTEQVQQFTGAVNQGFDQANAVAAAVPGGQEAVQNAQDQFNNLLAGVR